MSQLTENILCTYFSILFFFNQFIKRLSCLQYLAVTIKILYPIKNRAFNNSIEKVVKNRKNYKTLSGITTPATLIYGDADQFIASYNIPKVLKDNPKYISAIKTSGRHGVSREKYSKMVGVLEEVLNV